MTIVIESPRTAGGRGKGSAVTPSLSRPSAVPLFHHCCYSTQRRPRAVGRTPWRSCILTQPSGASQQLPGLLTSSPGQHPRCSRQPSKASPAGNRLIVPTETSYSTGRPGSKHLCFFWNQTPGTGFFLHRHFPQFTKYRASQVLCHQPALWVRPARPGSPTPNVLTHPPDPSAPPNPLQDPRLHWQD